MSETFPVILLLARPAAGKSEVIDFLTKLPPKKRKRDFHIGEPEIIDDFPMLWTWFEEDAILKEMEKPSLHTDEKGFFKDPALWNLLIRRIDLEYHKRCREYKNKDAYHNRYTTVMEFSRGKEHGGFGTALGHLSGDVLKLAAVLYIDVSWEESLRKNRARANPEKPHSILEHSVPETNLEVLYRESDWEDLSGGKSQGFLPFPPSGKLPFVVMENEDDCTSHGGAALEKRLKECFARLWDLYSSSRQLSSRG